MRELSLHMLDIMENSVRAGATRLTIVIELDEQEQWLTLGVEDNGPGLPVSPEQALDPFFTTKTKKRTGLGLSLFQAAAQQAGGNLSLQESESGGIRVRATFQYRHLDRAPLGDMAGSLMALALSNPDISFTCICRGPQGASEAVSHQTDPRQPLSFTDARAFGKRVQESIAAAGINA